MKTYLSAKEMNDLLFTFQMSVEIADMIENWDQRGNLTKSERKNLKTSCTFANKAIKEVLERMDPKVQEQFIKRTVRAINEPIRIVDKWTLDRVFGQFETEYEVVKIERNKFEKIAFLGMKANCEDCSRHFSVCELHDLLVENLVPTAEQLTNCPYACISEKRRKAQEEKRQAKLENKGKVSKRKAKKQANRFDEEEEGYTYNFTPKGER